jgi:hypothetical protein
MRDYQILELDGKRSRRTIADALAVLEMRAAFGQEDIAEIRVRMMPLRPDKSVGIVQVVFDVPCSENSYAIPLPSAEYFRGMSADGHRKRHRIELLAGALTDAKGNVRLGNGDAMRAVEVEPARLPLAPTKLDWRIIRLAIACCWTAEDAPFSEPAVHEACYRPLTEAIRPEHVSDTRMVPDVRLLNCGALTDVWVPSLDAIGAYWAEVYPRERVPSPQKIADTLADFRMGFPRHFWA